MEGSTSLAGRQTRWHLVILQLPHHHNVLTPKNQRSLLSNPNHLFRLISSNSVAVPLSLPTTRLSLRRGLRPPAPFVHCYFTQNNVERVIIPFKGTNIDVIS